MLKRRNSSLGKESQAEGRNPSTLSEGTHGGPQIPIEAAGSLYSHIHLTLASLYHLLSNHTLVH